MEDAALERGFHSHETWAFDEAYERFGALLFSVALRIGGCVEEAEDCVHDVLVRLWKTPNLFSTERGTLRAFLVASVRNEAISHLRAANRRSRLYARVSDASFPAETFEIVDFVEHNHLRSALQQLPEEQRIALVLAYFGGMTHVEVAQALEQPLGTVKSRISLGLRRLNSALSVGAQA